MLLNIGSIKDYALALVCTCGQYKVSELVSVLPCSAAYGKRVLSEMSSQRILLEKEIEGVKFYRLGKKGLEKAGAISNDLCYHYNNITGNLNFNGRPAQKIRMLKLNILLNELISYGISIDLIKIEYSPNNFGRKKESKQLSRFGFRKDIQSSRMSKFNEGGELKSASKIIMSIEPHTKTFLTSKALKNFGEAGKGVGRNILYRLFGVLIKDCEFFPVYIMKDVNEIWSVKVEEHFKLNMLLNMERKFGMETILSKKETYPNGRCIFFIEDEDIIADLLRINRARQNKAYIYPPRIYSASYFLPRENRQMLLDMLLTENVEDKIKSLLFTEDEMKEAHISDAIVDGKLAYELLTYDLNKFDRALTYEKYGKEILLVIHENQKSIVEKVFRNATLVVCAEKDLYSLRRNF